MGFSFCLLLCLLKFTAERVSAEVVPGKYFVELDPSMSATSARIPPVESAARAAGLQAQTANVFNTLFSGFSLQFPTQLSDDDILKLTELPSVKNVYPIRKYRLPTSTVAKQKAKQGQGVLDMIGASRVHGELRVYGNNIRVGVIDSGIDYTHPDLGGCFGPKCRVVTGYDFVGSRLGESAPDPDPMDCVGHGTHVAGIIGAKGNVTGVAPGVRFGAYKVFDCNGFTTDEVIMLALERAVKDKMQVINLSMGIALGWAEWLLPTAANRLVTMGIFVAAAAGNSGATTGLMSLGDLAAATNVMAVAAFNTNYRLLPSFSVQQPQGMPIMPFVDADPPRPFRSGRYLLTRTGGPKAHADACRQLSKGTLTNRVALILLGGCNPMDKAYNAKGAGARGVILYKQAEGVPEPEQALFWPTWPLPVVTVQRSHGLQLDKALAAGKTVAILFPVRPRLVKTAYAAAEQVAGFSSGGPSFTLATKPDIGAVGGFVYSTLPRSLTRSSSTPGYGSLSGTSMAAPMVAAAAALILQAQPSLGGNILQLNDILRNTAVPHKDSRFKTTMCGVQKQGAGLLNVYNAVTSRLRISPSRISLKDGNKQKTVSFTVKNTGKGSVVLVLMHKAGMSEGIFRRRLLNQQAPTNTGAQVSFKAGGALTVRAGGSVSISAVVRPPSGLKPLCIYSGYFQVVSRTQPSQVYSLPYLGMTGDYQSVPILQQPVTMHKCRKASYYDCDENAITRTGTVFTIGWSYPILSIPLSFATRSMTLQLINVKTNKVEASARKEYLSVYDYGPAVTEMKAPIGSLRGKGGGVYALQLIIVKPLGNPSDPKDVLRVRMPAITVKEAPRKS